jgi:hypothetical protein
MRFRINNREVIALNLVVQLAKAADREMRLHPQGTFAAAWRQGEIADGGEVVSHLLTPAIDEAESVIERLNQATGIRVE